MSKPETITFNINEDYSVEIKKFQGSYGEYYSVNGTNYDIHFPIDWVFQTPVSDSMIPPCFGPEECNLCAEYGYYGGVFIGYCLHCAKHADFKRGNGMISSGVEMDQVEADRLGIPIEYKTENSMWNVYMQTAELSQIGDEELLKKHISFFKKTDTERIFDFYGWLNASVDVNFYISDESESDNNILSVLLPEDCDNDIE